MQFIISHVNTDFDALASMFAAKKLYPDAQIVISTKQNAQVKQFLTIYRDALDFLHDNQVDWSKATELILVDVASLSRVGNFANQLHSNVRFTVFDHHPPTQDNVASDEEVIEAVGATVTLLMEEIIKRNIPISSFEATLFGLGLYTDTGSFTYSNTTARDFEAARFLMEQGMDLEMIERFSDHFLLPEQQNLLNHLFLKAKPYPIDGLEILVSSYQIDTFQAGLNVITEKLLDISGADAVLTIVKMKKHVYLVGRASAERINLLPLLKKFGGGGHKQAGSATVKKGNVEHILEVVTATLDFVLEPAITARAMMSSPVKTLEPDTTMEEAGFLMYRYGHSGYPVVEDGKLRGIITRRDLDKANHHGLGHAPVKGYMSTELITIGPKTTMEEIQKIIIKHNIGRLPVIENGKLIGIITRTNIIEQLHQQETTEEVSVREDLKQELKSQLPEEIYSLLEDISQSATKREVSVYLVGGIVRDILLGEPNDDIDIVVEGDGIAFAKQLHKDFEGELITHESFGTATWTHPLNLSIDISSARLEYYDKPASLPDVEISTLQEDLYRRDFTINAMAIHLTKDRFGHIVDPFHGQTDLRKKTIRVLHNLSFIEDPTRILRAVRFEKRLDFQMDEHTEKLALQSMDRVTKLSANRIIVEMKRLFAEVSPASVIQRLFELSFWQQFGIQDKQLKLSYRHAKQLETICYKKEENLFSYFVIPFYYEKNKRSIQAFALTKKQEKFLNDIANLSTNQAWKQIEKLGDFQRHLKDYSKDAILFIIAGEDITQEQRERLIAYVEKRKQMPTLLTGKDLISEGLKPSATFSNLLLELEVAILNEEIKTREEALKWLKNQLH